MPIISYFPIGTGGGIGATLDPVSNIETLAASGKAYMKWTDPDDSTESGKNAAVWAGTLLVRKAGAPPANPKDGAVVLDSKIKNSYADTWFCDSGLTNGTTYYYKLFPYTTKNVYTNTSDGEFSIMPVSIPIGNVTGMLTGVGGNGKIRIWWTDPEPSIVENGVTLAEWGYTTVVVKENEYASSPSDPDAAFVYKSVTHNAYASMALCASGLKNGTTYYISFFPTTTDGTVNGNAENRIMGTANRYTVDAPIQIGTLTYNGSVQSPEWNRQIFDFQFTIGGTTSAVNAGTYTISLTPEDDFMWGDGTRNTRNFSWSIQKAPGSLSLSKTSVSLSNSKLTDTITVTRAGDGAISATSSNTSVATVSVSGTTVTVRHVNQTSGSATITITVSAGTNHTAPGGRSISVTASFVKALNDCTWAQISEISSKGQGENYWNIGDRKGILVQGTIGTISINQTLYVYVLGFNHNSSKEGIGIQFGTFKTSLSGGKDVCLVDSTYDTDTYNGTKNFNLNHWGTQFVDAYSTNYGGWKGCDARYDILGSTRTAPSGYGAKATTSRIGYDAPSNTASNPVPNTLMAALASDLRAVMKPITKYTDNTGNKSNTSSNVTASTDYLPLLAEFEIFGTTRTSANKYEYAMQGLYSYYSAGNSKVKFKHNSTGTPVGWWGRSPCNSPTAFSLIYEDGSNSGEASSYSYGIAPIFMV